MPNNMEKIPVPLSQRLREIRVRLLPILVFIVVAMMVAYLWKERVETSTMTGRVVGKQAVVRSPQPGSLAELTVSAFDTVKAGDPVGRLITTDPEIIESELAVILAEIELTRLSMDPLAAQQRNLLDYESMHMDLMENRARLGIAQVREQQAEREFNRMEQLYKEGLTSEESRDRAETEYRTLREEVANIRMLVNRLEDRLEDIDLEELLEQWKKEDPKAAAIEVHHKEIERIKAEMMPVELHAPMSGQIAAVHKSNGEYVDRGDSILRIHSPQPDYILAHMKHPFVTEPEPGMEVLVRKQSRGREQAVMQIDEVGVQIETVDESVAFFPSQQYEAAGLPLRIAINYELNLMPGERVDMRLIRP